MWQAWTIGVLGVWLFIAAFLPFSPMGVLWDDLVVGVIVAITGFAIIKSKSWQGWTAGLLGIWLMIAAFMPSLQAHAGNLWNGIIVGILLMVAGFGALARKEQHAASHTG
ncbi:MAG: SPW repeat protein [Deltaproteobacteria bacterium]|nr:SPW repeat protein [Deltaproteobacteria bacterium]